MRRSIDTRILKASAAAIDEAAEILRAGGLVAFPTETVYGLGADATSALSVARIYEAKGRPSFNPLIAHVCDIDAAQLEGEFNATAKALAHTFWPGPLTLVVPRMQNGKVCDLARAGLDTLALRAPAHPVARALIATAGVPIAAPSANRSGHVSPTEAAHVAADLSGKVDLIIDGGRCAVGVESTIVACAGDSVRLLRPGGVTREMIERTIGRAIDVANANSDIMAPGMLASHYAPQARVRLNATGIEATEAALDFGGIFAGRPCVACRDLSPEGDLVQAAANLFGFLRSLDSGAATVIAVAPIPEHGLGEAINDRLRRAAADR